MIKFKINSSSKSISVFSTRPDTIFGATFLTLAPENELVRELTTKENKKEVEDYINSSSKKVKEIGYQMSNRFQVYLLVHM